MCNALNKVNRFGEITSEMKSLYEKKNADYGDSFNDLINEFGYVSALIRLKDKYNRVKNLLLSRKSPEVIRESVVDTLTDLANYAILLRMEIECRGDGKEINVEQRPEITFP